MNPVTGQGAPVSDTPERVVIHGGRGAGAVWPVRPLDLAPVLVGVVAALILLAALVWRMRSRRRRWAALAPDDRAFLDLARRLRLSGDAMAELRRLGGAEGVHPVALLVSPSALRGAIASHGDGTQARARTVKGLKSLAASA